MKVGQQEQSVLVLVGTGEVGCVGEPGGKIVDNKERERELDSNLVVMLCVGEKECF